MSKKAALPIALVAFGIFAITHSVGCSSGSSGGGTGGHADAGTGGHTATGGSSGTGGRVDAGTDAGTGGKIDSGTDAGTGGMGTGGLGTGGRIDSGSGADTADTATVDTHADTAADVPADAPADAPASTDTAATDTHADTAAEVAVDTGPADAGNPGLALAATLCPMFSATTTTSMTPTDFCTIYLSLCVSGRDAATSDLASCMARYNGTLTTPISASGSSTNGTIGACESYHVCNAYNAGAPSAATEAVHCPHAEGLALCL